jgi:site-specific DNA-methyltransferase (adenine-specific)
MESRTIQLTSAALKYGNLNLCSCGKDFFPPDVFGGPSKKAGLGKPITLQVKGLQNSIETDIPTDKKTGSPRWILRERKWSKDFVHRHKLRAGDTVTIYRIGERTYEVVPNNNLPQVIERQTSTKKAITKKKLTLFGSHEGKLLRTDTHLPYKAPNSKNRIPARTQTFSFKEPNILDHSLLNKMICGDNLQLIKEIPAKSINLVITSPPYYKQRDYGSGMGNEKSVEEYIENLCKLFHECIRVIKDDGSIVFNIGDKYEKQSLLLVPYRFTIAVLEKEPVELVNNITWVKLNPTPRQFKRRLVSSTEPFFHFVKSDNYYYDVNAFMNRLDREKEKKPRNNHANNNIGKVYFQLIERSSLSASQKILAKKELQQVIQQVREGKIASFRMKIKGIHSPAFGGQEGGRKIQMEKKGFTIIKIQGNAIKRDVIECAVETLKGSMHPAIYPEYIICELVNLLTHEGDVVLDPFMGSGTTAVACKNTKRKYIGFEINPDYCKEAESRIRDVRPLNKIRLEF